METVYLQALERSAQGDWDGAHRLIQPYSDVLACMIHGYLHRIEGDDSNASYWYGRAGHTLPSNDFQQEFERLYQMADQM